MHGGVSSWWRLGLVFGVLLWLGAGCARSAADTPHECVCVVGECDSLGRCVECLSSADCDDGLDCTSNTCVDGLCRSSADDSRCALGSCDLGLGCIECRSDADCADTVTCTQETCVAGHCSATADDRACGRGFCDRQRGCLECQDDGDCDDHVVCSIDACEQGVCAHVPLDSSCQGGFCDLTLGCVGCRQDADCADDVACTADACVAHQCRSEPNAESCAVGLQCDPERGCVGCLSDAECVDGVACTKDACIAGTCSNAKDDDACSSTQHCDAELDCIVCGSDAECQDGLFCSGHEVCSNHQQCTPGQARVCDDGIDCTVDVCSELAQGCVATPDSSLCPIGQQCFPVIGCGPRRTFYANTASALYLIDLSSTPPTAVRIGALTNAITDIAQTSDGRLFGISFDTLFVIDPATAALSEVGPLTISAAVAINGLTVAPDGTLYASAGPSLYRVDPASAASDLVGAFGPDIESSGDLVWGPLGAVFLSDPDNGGDALVSLDPLTAEATRIGSIGVSSVYGLSFSGGFLFGLGEGGELLQLEPTTGKATVIHNFNLAWWGAS